MAFPSDTGYKQLFSFPELARELLRVAVPQGWTKKVCPSDFVRLNASYVSPNGTHRDDDVVWCVHRFRRPSIYMLIEFQSIPDKWMATRMQGYAALLSDDLIKARRATHGKEPLLLPIVVYSGREAWPYRKSLGAFRPQAPPGLESLQPELNYVLIDRSIGPGVIRAVLEIDRADDEATDIPALTRLLSVWLERQHNDLLSRTLTAWVQMRLSAQFPDADLGRALTMEKIAMMFEHDFRNYTEVLEYRTLLRGRREGREEGLREGLQEGRQEGRQEGLQEGWQEGQQEGAKNALLAERRNTVRLLLEHAGKPLSQAGAQVLEQATPEQLLNWIHALIDSASVPPELLRR